MFEKLAEEFSTEMLTLSQGALHCIAYSRALLDFFELRGKNAVQLVVRAIVFGPPQPPYAWDQLNIKGLFNAAINSPGANGSLNYTIKSPEGEDQKLTIPFKTLGYPHSGADGNKELGNVEDNGWLGHMVVLADNTVIDLTIGQLNDDRFGVNFDPPYITIEADEKFLTGESALIVSEAGMLVIYRAYPHEETFKATKSWSDAGMRQGLRKVAQRVADRYAGEPDTNFHASNP